MATHSSGTAWRISWIEEPAGLWPMGSQSDTVEANEYPCKAVYKRRVLTDGGKTWRERLNLHISGAPNFEWL